MAQPVGCSGVLPIVGVGHWPGFGASLGCSGWSSGGGPRFPLPPQLATQPSIDLTNIASTIMLGCARRTLSVPPRTLGHQLFKPRSSFFSLPRSYATEASSSSSPSDGKLQLSLVLPHETIYRSSGVTQVNIAADSGDMGVLANHVASIESLKPGVVEVIEGQGESKKWFVSGGFANVHPNNLLTINAVEAYPLDAFSPEATRSALQEAQRALTSGSETQKAEAAVEIEVYESLLAALK